jgi:hypothetical protein
MQPNNILQFDPVEIKAGAPPSQSNPPAKVDLEKLALGLIPFTPVQFTGPDALLAWGRLAGYGLLAYLTYNKIRPVAYIALGAAGVSLATSLSAKAWGKK